MRDPDLRANNLKWWENQKREADWAKKDTRLESEAENLGLGFGETEGQDGGPGRLLTNIRLAVKDLGKLAWGWDDRGTADKQAESPVL
jgi:hypothetical protein